MLNYHEYDTDAIEADINSVHVNTSKKQSNIASIISDIYTYDLIQEYESRVKRMQNLYFHLMNFAFSLRLYTYLI